MTAWLEEARHLLRLSLRDYQTFGILVDSGRAELAPTCFHAQQAAAPPDWSCSHSDVSKSTWVESNWICARQGRESRRVGLRRRNVIRG